MPGTRNVRWTPARIAVCLLVASTMPLTAHGQKPLKPSDAESVVIPDFAPVSPRPATKTYLFIVDASKNVEQTFPTIKKELTTAVGGLDASRRFRVVLFAGGKAVAFDGGRMQPASAERKHALRRWLDTLKPGGGADPVAAIRVGMKDSPELAYLLTGGPFPDIAAVSKAVAAANGKRATRINPILMTDARMEPDENTARFLSKLADANGGKLKVLSVDDLEDQPATVPTTKPAKASSTKSPKSKR